MESSIRKCLECGSSIKGRSDKRYCDDQCRNAYNNRRNRDQNNYVRRVNAILRKNRSILEDVTPGGRNIISRRTLIDRGFDFRFFTHESGREGMRNYRFVYDLGYMNLDSENIAVIQLTP